jgi:predicted transcriptional regulator
MQAKPTKKPSVNYRTLGQKADRKILSLFPSLSFWKFANACEEKSLVLQRLACLYTVGSQGAVSVSKLTKILNLSSTAMTKEVKKLTAECLVNAVKNGKTTEYTLTAKGFVPLMSFEEFRDWARMKAFLSGPDKKNDPLAYALLVIGYSSKNAPSNICDALSKYAAKGHNMELSATDAIAESLLSFYRSELRTLNATTPNYLSVFKEFTTAGFQDVFRMLLMAIKPTAEDYNGLIEFFNEVAEFYYDPARLAYVNLLSENPDLQLRLDEFKKAQDQQIKKAGSNLEVTFNIPTAGSSKIDALPPHIRAMAMRLMLEPMKFINKELCGYFWAS